MRVRSWVLLFAGLFCLNSCSNVYSPYLHLPTSPLAQDQAEVMASASALPYPVPDFYIATGGFELLGRYALTDHVTLQGRAWTTQGAIRSGHLKGLSIESIIRLDEEAEGYRFALVPRAMVFTGNNLIDGWGLMFSGPVWTPQVLGLDPYVALGGALGAQAVESGWYGSRSAAFAYGTIMNFGLSYPILDRLHIHGEFAYSLLRNTYNDRWYWTLVPSGSMSWRF